MLVMGLWLRSAALLSALVVGSVQAQVYFGEPDPTIWLRQVYDLYQRAEKNPALSGNANFELVQKRASKALTALLKKDADCSRGSQGVCALDWDFVVDGQDYQLSNVNVEQTVVNGDKANVTVTFKNFDADCKNVYAFVREGGQWKVDDVVARSGAEQPVSIAKLVRDFKP